MKIILQICLLSRSLHTFSRSLNTLSRSNNTLSRSSIVAGCFVILLSVLLGACSSSGESKEETAQSTPAKSSDSSNAAEEPAAPAAARADTQTETVEEKIEKQAKIDEKKTKPQIEDVVVAPKIVAECKKERFVKLEHHAHLSMEKGKQATEAEIYGVGFKNADEYKRWGAMHNTVFDGVSKACAQLKECAKKYPKDRGKHCGDLADAYTDWKQTAKEFTKMVKSVETTQPPPLCSSPLAMEDPAKCFVEMADKIDSVCKSDDCKDASQCWRSVNILYGAINQEESACRYMHMKLSECNGYQEALRRRKASYKRCKYSMDKAGLNLAPVL